MSPGSLRRDPASEEGLVAEKHIACVVVGKAFEAGSDRAVSWAVGAALFKFGEGFGCARSVGSGAAVTDLHNSD
jgi:hypothetical protein